MYTDPISAAVAYRQALNRITQVTNLQEARKQAARALDIHFDRPTEHMISIASGYGRATKEPFVTFSMANPEETANPTIQIRSEDARRIAHQILDAADAAESDGFLVEWVTDTADMSDSQAGALLSEFREWREKRRKGP
jgi:hypothetical protein